MESIVGGQGPAPHETSAGDHPPAPAIDSALASTRPSCGNSLARLFRVLVLGGVVLAVACASVPTGTTGEPDGGPSDGGGVPGW
jgi:hypothetical protein